nr:phosphoenolpyruvate--protein phosphotransferase [uncultured Enterocloster sp.]
MYKGTNASDGIGIGTAVIVEEAELIITRREVNDTEAEVQRFKGALETTIAETQRMAEDLAARVGEKEAEIMQGHMMLLSDPMLTGEIENSIQNDKVNSEFAIENVCNMYADMFASMGDELMQQRATDMRDIKVRMQRTLMGLQSVDVSALPAGTILLAKDLTPSMTAGINPANVTGIVTELGGRTSHSAILARALEIPAVVAVNGLLDEVKDGDTVVLDGSTGEVYVNPEIEVKAAYEAKREQFLKDKKELEKYIGQPSVTKDGVQVEIVANIGKPEDIDKVLEYDAEGIGLFRTEFLFMDRTAMPTEEEQFEAYKKVAAAMNGKPVIIRTLDIGGDKEIPYMGLEKDENPFLGYRAIRLCLDRKEDIYKPQLRALLRASAFGNIRIMIPLVTCIDEFREAKSLIEELKKELDEKGIAYKKDIQVGIMVETAAASLIADIFAKEADFFSIGTNDLTQYTMSVDRGNKKVSYLYSTFNPAVLRSIRHIIACGREAGIMVGMCGEAASDPMMVPLLLAFGLNEFSMSASAVLRTRKLVTGFSIKELQAVAEKAMSFATTAEVEAYMKEFMEKMTD